MVSLASSRCVSCRKPLGVLGAKFCPDGHPQSSTGSVQDKDLESDEDDNNDNDDSSDSEVQFMGEIKRTTKIRDNLPLEDVKALRKKAGIIDANAKVSKARKGENGIRPQNAPPKTIISIWLTEAPPAKPTFSGIAARLPLDPSTALDSKEDVDAFIREAINEVPGLLEHKDFVSEELTIDNNRKAWVGTLEGNAMAWEDISRRGLTVKDVLKTLGPKSTLYFCVPVVRNILNTPVRKSKGHERGVSMGDLAPPSKKTKAQKLSDGWKIKVEKDKETEKEGKVKREEQEEVKIEVKDEEDSDDLPDLDQGQAAPTVANSISIRPKRKLIKKPTRYT